MSSGRLNLRLEPSTGSVGSAGPVGSAGSVGPAVRYRAELSAGRESWHGCVEVDAEGAVRFELGGEAPAWLRQAVSAILRAEWRNRRGADAAPWPRRITRWRLAPEREC
ncbi:MAG: hypothetical protein AMXMBFR56_68950 [Polyangiaceae bacterium]